MPRPTILHRDTGPLRAAFPAGPAGPMPSSAAFLVGEAAAPAGVQGESAAEAGTRRRFRAAVWWSVLAGLALFWMGIWALIF